MKKVLVVEDDSDQLNLIKRSLGKFKDQFEVVTASDGEEAIDILKYSTISLVLTDIQMPKLNGMILLAYVHTYHPGLPCIVMTAYGTSRLMDRLPEDLLRFFHKPIDMENLSHAVLAALKRDQAQKTGRGISVVKFLKLIQMERSSCILEIEPLSEPAGMMFFENGELRDAVCGKLGGEAAALTLIASEVKSYSFKSAVEKEIPRQIKTDMDSLIKNALGEEFLIEESV